ncbi:MAG: hypothetical protein ACOCUD_02970 [Bacillota bacterium]
MLNNVIKENGMGLIVSIPENSTEMARAAFEAGADAIKVHANVEHKASGNIFPSVGEQKQLFSEIIEIADGRPVGLVPGDDAEKITKEEIELAEELGFEFLSVYAHHAPVDIIKNSNLTIVIAFNDNYELDQLMNLEGLDIDAVEASLVSKDQYFKPLTYDNILNYNYLRNNTELPIVVPTQKSIKANEIKYLKDIGIEFIMIGAVVTGKSVEGVKKTTSEFKKQIVK